jgi:uncharacterized membrane protein (DUF485 family)
MEHWFWAILSVLVLVWYCVVTIVVAFRGGNDIKKMLAKWKQEMEE